MHAATVHRNRELQAFLHRCRERVGISQAAAAQSLHLSPRGYWNLEHGRVRYPSESMLDTLADLLQLTSQERWALYMLTVRHEPPTSSGPACDDTHELTEWVTVQNCPAVIADHAWKTVAGNSMYWDLPLADSAVGRVSFLGYVLLIPSLRDTFFGAWEDAWATPLLKDIRTAGQIYPEARWPQQMLSQIKHDQRLQRIWRRLDTLSDSQRTAARPLTHPTWGPQVAVIEAVPRYLNGYRIISLVPVGRQRVSVP